MCVGYVKRRINFALTALSLPENIMTVKKILLITVIGKPHFGTVLGTRCF